MQRTCHWTQSCCAPSHSSESRCSSPSLQAWSLGQLHWASGWLPTSRLELGRPGPDWPGCCGSSGMTGCLSGCLGGVVPRHWPSQTCLRTPPLRCPLLGCPPLLPRRGPPPRWWKGCAGLLLHLCPWSRRLSWLIHSCSGAARHLRPSSASLCCREPVELQGSLGHLHLPQLS